MSKAMSLVQFPPEKRYAIYLVHGEACWLCRKPIDYASMEVDHLVPEILKRKPDRLTKALTSLGLPAAFDINGYGNLFPACGPCNIAKRAREFEPAPILLEWLTRARERAPEAEAIAARLKAKRAFGKSLADVLIGLSQGTIKLTQEQLDELLQFHKANRNPQLATAPIKISPFFEVLSDNGSIQIVRGRFGVGGRPLSTNLDGYWPCPTCGPLAAWNGARCVVCGMMDDD
jgi:5-methylcytosine-specific restriction endonuclease McrA